MELKVWVEGIQRVVCGVSEATTCQEVVIALAHATGQTGRFTLVERWRDNERLVAPRECPLRLLRDWGEYASHVSYVLRHSSASSRAQQGRHHLNSPRQGGLGGETQHGRQRGQHQGLGATRDNLAQLPGGGGPSYPAAAAAHQRYDTQPQELHSNSFSTAHNKYAYANGDYTNPTAAPSSTTAGEGGSNLNSGASPADRIFHTHQTSGLSSLEISLNKGNVKRNLTFSGAHVSRTGGSALAPPPPSRPSLRQAGMMAPFENSSLGDSVEEEEEEQSSFTTHSTASSNNSPYSSFQGSRGGGGGGGAVSRSGFSGLHHPRAATHSYASRRGDAIPEAYSPNMSGSPEETPTNSLERGGGSQRTGPQSYYDADCYDISAHFNDHKVLSALLPMTTGVASQQRGPLDNPHLRFVEDKLSPRVSHDYIPVSRLKRDNNALVQNSDTIYNKTLVQNSVQNGPIYNVGKLSTSEYDQTSTQNQINDRLLHDISSRNQTYLHQKSSSRQTDGQSHEGTSFYTGPARPETSYDQMHLHGERVVDVGGLKPVRGGRDMKHGSSVGDHPSHTHQLQTHAGHSDPGHQSNSRHHHSTSTSHTNSRTPNNQSSAAIQSKLTAHGSMHTAPARTQSPTSQSYDLAILSGSGENGDVRNGGGSHQHDSSTDENSNRKGLLYSVAGVRNGGSVEEEGSKSAVEGGSKGAVPLLRGWSLEHVTREELVKLVNLQIERLNGQESELQALDRELSRWERIEEEALKRQKDPTSAERFSELEAEQSRVSAELAELEAEDLEGRLEQEREMEQQVRAELSSLRAQLAESEARLRECGEVSALQLEVSQQQRRLAEEREAEERLKREVDTLRSDLCSKQGTHELSLRSLEELTALVKDAEAAILEKNGSLARLEAEIKEVNLELFNVEGPQQQEGEVAGSGHSDSKEGTFTRSSSSRPSSSRVMPTTPARLKEAIQAEPQGYWV